MAFSKEQLRSELIDQVLERVHARFEGTQAANADFFVRSFYAHVPPDDILCEEPENLYGAALSLWGLARERRPKENKVRVYNPRQHSHGWSSSHTVVEVVTDAMPFLVDSMTNIFPALDSDVQLVVYPVLQLRRDDGGRFVELVTEGGNHGANRVLPEALMHFQVSEQRTVAHDIVHQTVSMVLADVRDAFEDSPPMRARCTALIEEIKQKPPPVPPEKVAEGMEFLEWLTADNFTFLGYREYALEGENQGAVFNVVTDSGLGILRRDEVTIFAERRSRAPTPANSQSFLRRPELLAISKAARRSSVHRSEHLDTISTKLFSAEGEVVRHRLFVGLFTATAYAARLDEIPVLRRKVAWVFERSGILPNSYGGQALTQILTTYPRDELFQITEEELYQIALGILHLQERHRIAFFPRRDTFERYVSCLIYVPRDRYDTRLRLKLQKILSAAYEGQISDFYIHLTESRLAQLRLIVQTTPGHIPEVDVAALEQKLIAAGRSWSDRLQEALIEARGEEQGITCIHRFGEAFSASYQDHFNAQTAVSDILKVEQALESGLALNLYRPIGADERELRLKIYFTGQQVPLSEVLPMLENSGLKVINESPYAVRPADLTDPVWIRDYVMRIENGGGVRLAAIRSLFHDALRLIWHGEMESDGFNRLVLCAGLSAREVTVLRALCKYLLQARIPFSQTYMEQTLAGNPEIARLLVQLFLRRFDPFDPFSASERRSEGELTAEIERRLEHVDHLDEDRIIRRFSNLIQSTLRTNFFQPGTNGEPKPYISFKFDSKKISDLPWPRPLCEIFVYSSRFEAVHLRGGRVALGGIRWSDRREDYRTEVLGLMMVQMVKNAIVVPVGSKGGFVLKQSPFGRREELMGEVVNCYQTMMRGILDLTDNLVAGEVVTPRDVVRYDGDDPYLVVAADKGTATFSDIANGISEEYGFWLGDAFASGGSAGYDHKGMGITARGAWESVKRHFRERGKDIQAQDFTAVGVGDMSGDIFGNGMLLSQHMRLFGAFNHLHIFVDPDPDPVGSWHERLRLFKLPRSSWSDYDPQLISAGGGVFDRAAKSIALSPQIRKLFGIKEEWVTPHELIRKMLSAEVELLWIGGIGTYVKAREETHATVGDRANDPLRVDASEVRARVIGEGANLGVTQRARIELGQLGCRLNTDSIDNSAGVDCSDHEVNIKILLGEVVAAGDLTRKHRGELLREMTEELGELVLRDNYLQTQAITVARRLGARLSDRTGRFIRGLERTGRLDRKNEFLPDDEAIAERIQRGQGFTRPEIAVLLSYAKMELYDELLASALPEDRYMEAELSRYFPRPLRERFPGPILRHRLRREIIATVVTNDIVNRVGITFLHEVRERTGMVAADIARAYVIAREIFRMRELWNHIEGLDNRMPSHLQASMLADCGRLIERGAVWFLREEAMPLDISAQVERYATGVRAVVEGLETLLSETDKKLLAERVAGYIEEGAPEDVAVLAARLPLLAPSCDIVRIARDVGVGVSEVGSIYFALGSRLGFDWLRRSASHIPSESAWDTLAITAIIDDLYGHQSNLTRRVIEATGDGEIDDGAIENWAEIRRSLISQVEQLLAELQTVASPTISMMAVANGQLEAITA